MDRGITAEMITAAAEAMEDAAVELLGRDLGTIHRDEIAERALRAALAGYAVVAEPVDPTTIPDPRRWGTEFRTGKLQRVYWDASLAARGEVAWTNMERTERFTPEMVRGDKR